MSQVAGTEPTYEQLSDFQKDGLEYIKIFMGIGAYDASSAMATAADYGIPESVAMKQLGITK